MPLLKQAFLAGLFSFLSSAPGAWAQEFVQEQERDFPLKTTGSLKIVNQRGSTSVLGWSMDRIRVKIRRRVQAETQEEANKVFASLEVSFKDRGADLELLVEAGRGFELSDRLKERKQPRSEVDLDVRGPANLKLDLWSVNAKLKVHNWNAPVSARLSSGSMEFTDISASTPGVSTICADCTIDLERVKANVRAVSQSGKITLKSAQSKEVFVETVSGPIEFTETRGEQTYVTSSGAIKGSRSRGSLELRTRAGVVLLSQIQGTLSGRSDSGNVALEIEDWNPENRVFLESDSGQISLKLPYRFSSVVDFWAQEGKIDSEVEVRSLTSKPAPPLPVGQRLQGQLGNPLGGFRLVPVGSEVGLRALSRKGSIQVRRSSPTESPQSE